MRLDLSAPRMVSNLLHLETTKGVEQMTNAKLSTQKLLSLAILMVATMGLLVGCAKEKNGNTIKRGKKDKPAVVVPATEEDRIRLEQMRQDRTSGTVNPSNIPSSSGNTVSLEEMNLPFPIIQIEDTESQAGRILGEPVDLEPLPQSTERTAESIYERGGEIIGDDVVLERSVQPALPGVPLPNETLPNSQAFAYHEMQPKGCNDSFKKEAFCFFRYLPDRDRNLRTSENCYRTDRAVSENGENVTVNAYACELKFSEEKAWDMAEDMVLNRMSRERFQQYKQTAYFLMEIRDHRNPEYFLFRIDEGGFESSIENFFGQHEWMGAIDLTHIMYKKHNDYFNAEIFEFFFKCMDRYYRATDFYEKNGKNRRYAVDKGFDYMHHFLKHGSTPRNAPGVCAASDYTL